jgi:hypothetical protein
MSMSLRRRKGKASSRRFPCRAVERPAAVQQFGRLDSDPATQRQAPIELRAHVLFHPAADQVSSQADLPLQVSNATSALEQRHRVDLR